MKNAKVQTLEQILNHIFSNAATSKEKPYERLLNFA